MPAIAAGMSGTQLVLLKPTNRDCFPSAVSDFAQLVNQKRTASYTIKAKLSRKIKWWQPYHKVFSSWLMKMNAAPLSYVGLVAMQMAAWLKLKTSRSKSTSAKSKRLISSVPFSVLERASTLNCVCNPLISVDRAACISNKEADCGVPFTISLLQREIKFELYFSHCLHIVRQENAS